MSKLHVYNRLSLLDDLDFLLEVLKKGKKPDFPKKIKDLEDKLNKALYNAWTSKSKKAVSNAVAALLKYSTELNEVHAQAIAEGLNITMGEEFVKLVQEQELVDHVIFAYDMSGERTSTQLKVPKAFTIVDENAKQWLKQDTIYWIGNYYNNHIKDAVTSTVIEYAINQGQSAWTTGQRIKDILLGTYEIPPGYLPSSYVRADAYFQGLAANAITRATVFGSLSAMERAKVETYEILSAEDLRVCQTCRHMNGKRFELKYALDLREKVLNSTSPEDIKNVHPWKKFEEIKDLDVSQLASMGFNLPPFHFNCRCTIVSSTFSVEEGEPLVIQTKPVEEVPPLEPQTSLPQDFSGLEFVSSSNRYVSNTKTYLYQDSKGNKYLFETPLDKKLKDKDISLLKFQETVSQLSSKLFDPGDFREVRFMSNPKGEQGILQRTIEDSSNLEGVQFSSLTESQLGRILEEHVLDWLTCNISSGPNKFIKTTDGRIFGTDKNHLIDYIFSQEATNMLHTYGPKPKVGTTFSTYSTLFRSFAKGEVNLNLQAVLPVIQRLESIPIEEYKNLFRPYLEMATGKNAEIMDIILERIVARRKEIREQYRGLFTQLLKERYPGFNGSFKFLDEMNNIDFSELPVSARSLCRGELSKFTEESLIDLAKALKIPHFDKMTTQELITVLSDPNRLQPVLDRIQQKLNNEQKSRLSPAKETPPGQLPTLTGSDELLDDLSLALKGKVSNCIRRDGDSIEGLNISIRKVEFEGEGSGYQIFFKVNPEYGEKLGKYFKERGIVNSTFAIGIGKYQKELGTWKIKRILSNAEDLNFTYTTFNCKWTIKDNCRISFFDDIRTYSTYNMVYIDIPISDGILAARKLKEILQDYFPDYEKVFASRPLPENIELHKLSSLIWQLSPRTLESIPPKERTLEKLRKIVEEKGWGKYLEDMKETHPISSHIAYHSSSLAEEYRNKGAYYLWAGTNSIDGIVEVLKSGALLSTNMRKLNGLISSNVGISELSDIYSGGADSIFTRLVTRSAQGKVKYSSHPLSGKYRFIIDSEVLGRSDWYAFRQDNYGVCKTGDPVYSSRSGTLDFVSKLQSDYSAQNEVMFRKGMGKKYLRRIVCDTEEARQELLEVLRREGITQVNKTPIDMFVLVKEYV